MKFLQQNPNPLTVSLTYSLIPSFNSLNSGIMAYIANVEKGVQKDELHVIRFVTFVRVPGKRDSFQRFRVGQDSQSGYSAHGHVHDAYDL